MFNWFERARAYYTSLSPPKYEALTLGMAVLVGLLIMPALIYLVGSLSLREYANGGLFALYVDFFKGLFEPRPSCWIVVAGPFVMLCLFRIFRLILRKI